MSTLAYKSDKKIRTVTAVGLFAALAYILTLFFRFKLAFLTFDLKDAVMTISAMLFGPLSGLALAILVPLLETLISSTGLYGFVMNAILFLGYCQSQALGNQAVSQLSSALSSWY